MSGACCNTSFPGGCIEGLNITETMCHALGGFWGGEGTECAWYDCTAHLERGACCTIWGCAERTTEVRCAELGGSLWARKLYCSPNQGPAINCPPIEDDPESGCYQARPDRSAGRQSAWTDDLCATVEFQPGRFQDEAGPYFQLFSTRPTRALGVMTEEEPCRYQVTDMFLDEWGYAAPVLCNNPFPGLPVAENRVGELYCMAGDGEAGLYGGYHTPYWTEAILRSSALRCCGVYH